MTAFALKIIALLSMLVDHVGVVFDLHFGFRVVGRIAFPIFVFFVAEGFRHTKSPAKFLARLFVFALISQPVFAMAIRGATFQESFALGWGTNIFFTLFLGGFIIVAYDWRTKCAKRTFVSEIPPRNCGAVSWHMKQWAHPLAAGLFFLAAMLGVAMVADVLSVDYGFYGALFIFAMYLVRRYWPPDTQWGKVATIGVMGAFALWQHQQIVRDGLRWGFGIYPTVVWLMIPATLLPVALVAWYNGKRGPGMKWLFYIAYPLHLGVLVWLSTAQ